VAHSVAAPTPDPDAARAAEPPRLVRALGAWDGALITIGSVIGTGVFLTTADMARVLPHPGLILLAWALGGLLTVAGALTLSELGTMFPRAGGQYHFLREAFGAPWGFLFGWASLLVIMTGGIATLAVGFGEYLGFFVPFFSTGHVVFTADLGVARWSVNGGQLAAGLTIALLTAVNVVGLRAGAHLQNAVTVVKIGSLLGLIALGLLAPAPAHAASAAPAATASAGLLAAFGVAMISVLWSYDGWYGVTLVGGEMKRPDRDVPRGLLVGTVAVTAIYVLVNVVYIRALPVEAMAATGRIGEAAAAALFGPWGARLVSVAVLVSTFGCLSATILYAARAYLPMAEDGLFFSALARIHPRYRTPVACLVVQGVWATVQAFSGTYAQLYTYVVFVVFLFHAATGAALFVLRRTRPDAPRPYRAWGYPLVPLLFIASSLALVANTLWEKPVESLGGLVLVASGVPVYWWWRRRR
jgi:basic amino acid/polyamine antiporter, APA family